jgi:hypothetical protein
LDAQARRAVLLQLEFLPRARLARAALHVAQQEQLAQALVLRRRVLRVLLRQLEKRLAARQLVRVHAERLEQWAWRLVQRVLRAQWVRRLERRQPGHRVWRRVRLLPSRPFRKLRRLRRQLRLALMIGNAS